MYLPKHFEQNDAAVLAAAMHAHPLATLIVATNVIAEAGLSFLGLGIPAPTASWGNLLAEGPNYYLTQPWLMVWPELAILLTTLALCVTTWGVFRLCGSLRGQP